MVVVERSIPGQLVGNPIVGCGVLIGCCFLDDIQESAMIDVVYEETRSILLRAVLDLGFRDGYGQGDPMPAIYGVHIVESSRLARNIKAAQVPWVEIRGKEDIIDKALDLSVGFEI